MQQRLLRHWPTAPARYLRPCSADVLPAGVSALTALRTLVAPRRLSVPDPVPLTLANTLETLHVHGSGYSMVLVRLRSGGQAAARALSRPVLQLNRILGLELQLGGEASGAALAPVLLWLNLAWTLGGMQCRAVQRPETGRSSSATPSSKPGQAGCCAMDGLAAQYRPSALCPLSSASLHPRVQDQDWGWLGSMRKLRSLRLQVRDGGCGWGLRRAHGRQDSAARSAPWG